MNNKFVSRAGEKLEFALDKFKISVTGLTCADFGSSTGGFTDCLLQNGAKKVYSIDTSYGELDYRLRKDKRVFVLERTNAMHVSLPELVDLITIDVSWTRLSKVIPNAIKNLKEEGRIIALIKPHYEADYKFIKKGKLMEDKIPEVLDKVKGDVEREGVLVHEIIESPIEGKRAKNREFLAIIG